MREVTGIKSLIFLSCVFVALQWGAVSVAQSKYASENNTMPSRIKFIENDKTVHNINYACFRLAQKAKAAFDDFEKNKNLNSSKETYIGKVSCTSDEIGQYVHVAVGLSYDEFDPNNFGTDGTLVASTSDAAKTFKWSIWPMYDYCLIDDWKACIDKE